MAPSAPTHETGKRFWDSSWKRTLATRAPGPDTATWANTIDARKMEFLRPWIPRAGGALEVGCGSARLLCRVGREAPLRLVGLDSAPSALELAHQTAQAFGVQVETVEGQAEILPFPTGSFDIVVSGGLLEHFADPQPVLREMVRILKPGGVFYADVVPRKLSWYRLREAPRMARSSWLADGVYESSYGPDAYRHWLEASGVEGLQTVSCGVYPGVLEWAPGAVRTPAAKLFQRLDATKVADLLGWYFMIAGRKA